MNFGGVNNTAKPTRFKARFVINHGRAGGIWSLRAKGCPSGKKQACAFGVLAGGPPAALGYCEHLLERAVDEEHDGVYITCGARLPGAQPGAHKPVLIETGHKARRGTHR